MGVIKISALNKEPSFLLNLVLTCDSPFLLASSSQPKTFWITISASEKIETLFIPINSSLEYPNISRERKADKLRFRYPQGESYIDLFERLKYFVLQLNSFNKPILIVAHNAIIKVLLGYFESQDHEKIPHMNINLGNVIKLTPNSKDYNIETINLM